MRHIDSELRRLKNGILSDIPSLMFEIRRYVEYVQTVDDFPSLLKPGFEIPEGDPLQEVMRGSRKDWLIELGRSFIDAMRDVREYEEILTMNRDLLSQARIEIVKATGDSLIPLVDGKSGTSLHDAALFAACKPLNLLVVGISKVVSTLEDELHFWQIVHEATIAEEPDEETMATLVERTFNQFHSWASLGTKGWSSDEAKHELEILLNFERVQAVQLANESSPFVWGREQREHSRSAIPSTTGEPEIDNPGEGRKARSSVEWSEPMCLADAGRKIWPSLFANKSDPKCSKAAARRVQKAMEDGWLQFEKLGTSDYHLFDKSRFQK